MGLARENGKSSGTKKKGGRNNFTIGGIVVVLVGKKAGFFPA